MENPEDNYEKHPDNFRGLSPGEFAEEFGNTNYFYQKRCFEKLVEEYFNQSEADRKRNRPQLSLSLENLSIDLYQTVKSFTKVCNVCRNYLRNPFGHNMS